MKQFIEKDKLYLVGNLKQVLALLRNYSTKYITIKELLEKEFSI